MGNKLLPEGGIKAIIAKRRSNAPSNREQAPNWAANVSAPPPSGELPGMIALLMGLPPEFANTPLLTGFQRTADGRGYEFKFDETANTAPRNQMDPGHLHEWGDQSWMGFSNTVLRQGTIVSGKQRFQLMMHSYSGSEMFGKAGVYTFQLRPVPTRPFAETDLAESLQAGLELRRRALGSLSDRPRPTHPLRPHEREALQAISESWNGLRMSPKQRLRGPEPTGGLGK